MASGPITSWKIDGETMETVTDFLFSVSKITADGDCSLEIKRYLLFGRKAMTNLNLNLKSTDITLLTKVRLVKAMVFPVVMYGCKSWIIKKLSSVTQSCQTLCNPMACSTPVFLVHQQLLELAIKSVMPSNHLIHCHSLLLLPSIFPSIRVFSNESSIKKAEHQRIDAFKLWCWRRLLRIPWTTRGSNQSILKEINPEYSLEGLMLKVKLQHFGHLM